MNSFSVGTPSCPCVIFSTVFCISCDWWIQYFQYFLSGRRYGITRGYIRAVRGCLRTVQQNIFRKSRMVLAKCVLALFWSIDLWSSTIPFESFPPALEFDGLFKLQQRVAVSRGNWITAFCSDLEESLMHPTVQNNFAGRRKQKLIRSLPLKIGTKTSSSTHKHIYPFRLDTMPLQ